LSSSRYEKKVIRVGVLVIQYVMSVDTSGKICTFSGRLGGEYTVWTLISAETWNMMTT
jgi:hypothetical protein